MRFVLFLLVLAGPVVMGPDGCPSSELTCREICRQKLGRKPFIARQIGTTSGEGWRVCECYPTREVVVDDLPPYVPEAPK